MEGDPGSPYYLFTQAEVNLQWAALSIKFGEYLNSIFEIRKAYKLLEENQNKFPDFKANKNLSECFMHYWVVCQINISGA